MKTAAARVDQTSARHLSRRDAEDSRVRMRAPLPPPGHDCEPVPSESDETSPDFLQFLCGRFEVDREGGMALLATLLEGYVPREAYPIHTLEPANAERAVSE